MHYNRSETLKELAPALAKAMGEIGPAMKDTLNPHFGKKYVTLAGCHAVAIGPLRENGFSFPMFPSCDVEKGTVTVTALLLHVSGEWLEGSLTIPLPNQSDAQKVIAAETYARRGLYAMVGVVPDDDDDGETAVGRGQGAPQRQEQRREPPAPKPRQEPAKSPSQPPKQLGEELADRGVIKPPAQQGEDGTDNDPPAKNDELMNTLLGEAFQTLSKAGMNAQQKVILAKKATDGKHPNEWKVSDGKKFLNFMAQEFPQ